MSIDSTYSDADQFPQPQPGSGLPQLAHDGQAYWKLVALRKQKELEIVQFVFFYFCFGKVSPWYEENSEYETP